MLRRVAILGIVGIAAVVAVVTSVVSRREVDVASAGGEREVASTSREVPSASREIASASRETEQTEGAPQTPSQRTLVRMQAIRQDVHILEIQRLDARERGDHDAEARLDREILAARAEHDRLRQTLSMPEGI